MSQWTHVLGVVRYDSSALNVFPAPYNKEEICHKEMTQVSSVFQSRPPYGSEGPIEVNFKLTGRGPTVLITGDLRDFGKEDLKLIVEWLNQSEKILKKRMLGSLFWIRDASIICDVEYDENTYLITLSKDREFCLKTFIKET